MTRNPPPRGQAIVLYMLFAGVATLTNIAAQEVTIRLSPVHPLALSILAGTVVGFAVKYLLDKFYVFDDRTSSATHEARKVALYGAFSVLTTLVFWTFELVAWSIWGTDFAKYAGAVTGLAIGYAAKFVLDSRYVFRGEPA